MGYLEDINASYAEHQRMADAYAGVDANQQHAAHLVMQQLVAQRDAYVSSLSGPTSNPAPASNSPQPPPPAPAPLLPTFRPMGDDGKSFKVAPSDIIQFDEDAVGIATIQDLLFEDIGATELANISRSDLVDGQDTIYSPIKNLSSVRREFNPNNVVATAYNSDYFTRFGIDLNARVAYEPYFDENGDLVIEVEYVLDNEEIQVQVLANGTIDTIEES
jgi:hypothetical protein